MASTTTPDTTRLGRLAPSMDDVGFPGDRSVAAHLARAGWKLARRTVRRIRKEKPIVLPPAPVARPCTDRAVRARYPHHVWMLDLTEIPGFLRLFCFKLVVVLDVFSVSFVAVVGAERPEDEPPPNHPAGVRFRRRVP